MSPEGRASGRPRIQAVPRLSTGRLLAVWALLTTLSGLAVSCAPPVLRRDWPHHNGAAAIQREVTGCAISPLDYPRNLVANLLQGEWQGAGNETKRFAVNAIYGIGGLASFEDLGQARATPP